MNAKKPFQDPDAGLPRPEDPSAAEGLEIGSKTSSGPNAGDWTAADLFERFGAIPLARVRFSPSPGTATERDVLDIYRRENRLYEVFDGVLIEKTAQDREASLASRLARAIGTFVRANDLGIVLEPSQIVRLAPGVVRIPDVAFATWHKLPERVIPRGLMVSFVPDLIVEVTRRGSTAEEMERRLAQYLGLGVRQVWYVYPASRELQVFLPTAATVLLTEAQSLACTDLLPGFQLLLRELFAAFGPGEK